NLAYDQVDASGFNATGAKTTLIGQGTYEVSIDFFWTPAVHGVLYSMFQNQTPADFVWRPDVNSGASANNPELRGPVILFTYPPEAQRGSVRTFTATFTAADGEPLVFYET